MARQLDTYRARAIGTLRRKIGMDDDTYHEMLSTGWDVASCLDLTPEQADTLIEHLTRKRAEAKKVYASAAMHRRLQFHAIRCAIHYIRAEDLKAWSDPDGDGEVLTGDSLRWWIARRWEGSRVTDVYRNMELAIPKAILDRLYTRWINPTSNRFLVEGGFKRRSVAPARCYYRELSADAVRYLIARYREMHAAIDRRAPHIQQSLPTKEE